MVKRFLSNTTQPAGGRPNVDREIESGKHKLSGGEIENSHNH